MGIHEDLMKLNLYNFLNCEVTADESQIRKAFRKKSLMCHPDKHPNNPKAVEMFKMLNGAVEILTDPKLRACYDRRRMARMLSYSRRWSGVDYSTLKKEIEKRAASSPVKLSAENLRRAFLSKDLSPSTEFSERDANRKAREERLKRQRTNEFPSCNVQSSSQKSSKRLFYSSFPSTSGSSTNFPSTSGSSTNFPSTSRSSTNFPSTSRSSTNFPSTGGISANFPSTSWNSMNFPSESRSSTNLSFTSRSNTEKESSENVMFRGNI